MSIPTYDITPPNPRKENRRNARQHVEVGLGLAGAGTAASFGANRRVRRVLGSNPSVKAEIRGRLKPRHLGVKLGARSAQITGLSLAAYGAKHLIHPDRKIDPVSVKEDIARPMARAATFQPTSKALVPKPKALRTVGQLVPKPRTTRGVGVGGGGSRMPGVAKAWTETDQGKLRRRRRVGRALSIAGGSMGLAALGLRAPSAAKVAVNRGVRAPGLASLAARDAAATKHSNTLGVLAVGTGSAGSFNYASQQKLERRKEEAAVAKIAPRMVYHGTTKRAARKIMESGFREGRDFPEGHIRAGDLGQGPYVSPSKKIAGAFSAFPNADKRRAKLTRTINAAQPNGSDEVKALFKTPKVRKILKPRKRGRVVAAMAVGPARAGRPGDPGSWQSTYHADQLIPVGTSKGPKPRAGFGRMERTIGRYADKLENRGTFESRRAIYRRNDEINAARDRAMAIGKAASHLAPHLANRVSPQAEASYNRMHRDRSEFRVQAAGQGALAGVLGASAAEALHQSHFKAKWGTAATLAGAATTGYGAYRSAQRARGRTRAMQGIEAAARRRARAGQYGVGRGGPTDPTSRAKNLAAAQRS